MEGIVSEAVTQVLTHYGPLGFFVVLSGYLLWIVLGDRKKHRNGNSNGMVYVRKSEFDDHRNKTDAHFAVIEGRIAANYDEFRDFQVEAAKHLATKGDLVATEERIIKHIDLALKR